MRISVDDVAVAPAPVVDDVMAVREPPACVRSRGAERSGRGAGVHRRGRRHTQTRT